MPFNPQEFYTLARSLAETSILEANLRTAISRTYYAAHLLAREWLRTGGWEPTGRGTDHSEVIRKLKDRGRYRQLGFMIDELREFREHADYHLEPAQTQLNEYCTHCRAARESPSTDALVNENHWGNVRETSQHLFPRLNSL